VAPGKRVPKGELWGGAPAKKLRDLTEADVAFFPVSADNYVKLAAQYRTELG
jgi:carbonic anhydrase/acetyltransferase-like protein (isoleucine patch superfamily)